MNLKMKKKKYLENFHVIPEPKPDFYLYKNLLGLQNSQNIQHFREEIMKLNGQLFKLITRKLGFKKNNWSSA